MRFAGDLRSLFATVSDLLGRSAGTTKAVLRTSYPSLPFL